MQVTDNCDTIFLSDLRVRAIIGINDWERRVRQPVSIDLQIPADARSAARSDDISATVNYKAVAKRLIQYVSDSDFQLVESLAESLANIVLEEFSLAWVRVSVHKPGAIRGANDVGITICRGDIPGKSAGCDEVYVGLGSNVQPEKHFVMAIKQMTARFGPLRRSAVYRNPAVGFEGDDFLNMVVGFQSTDDPMTISAALGRIEQSCGRERSGQRYAPRTLDLDLMLCGQQVTSGAELVLPRPELLRHAFILRPLAELAGPVIHPVEKRSLAELWHESDLGDHSMTLVDIDFK